MGRIVAGELVLFTGATIISSLAFAVELIGSIIVVWNWPVIRLKRGHKAVL